MCPNNCCHPLCYTTHHLYDKLDISMTKGKAFKDDEMTRGNTAPHLIVRLKSYFSKAFHTGYWITGLVMVARLICQAKTDGVHSGPNANKAELAIGFHAKNIELCRKAKVQNMKSRSHLCQDCPA
jgi:hypothetical protein